jgi:hypothetical protein
MAANATRRFQGGLRTAYCRLISTRTDETVSDFLLPGRFISCNAQLAPVLREQMLAAYL